ncbi:MATE family efflux transporter [Chloroflexota bacterium]
MRSNMNDERRQQLATESVGKLLLKLSLPAGIGMFVMSLYNVIDTIFIGQVVGPMGIAGLSIVFPIQMLTMGLGMMIGIGGASLISRTLGAGGIEKSERTLGNALFCIGVIGGLIMLVVLPNSAFWLRLVGASETIMPYAKGYLDIVLIGIVFRICAMGASQLIRAEGNARVPMFSMIIGAVLNIILDAIFIIALNMGVQGAAAATVISEFVTCLYIAHYYRFQYSTLKFRIKNLLPVGSIIREIMVIGFGSFVRTVGGSLVAIIVNRTLITYGGDMAVASFGMVQRIMMFIFMPIMSVGQGLQPILGFSYGARRFDRALRAIKLSIIVTTILAFISFLVIYFLPAPFLRIFTSGEALISAGSHAAKIIFFVAYLIGFQMIGSVVFQAIGKAVQTFLTATARQILFLLPLIYILPNFLGLDGIWYSIPIADGLSFLLTLALFIPQIREFKKAEATTPEMPFPPGPDFPGGFRPGGMPGSRPTPPNVL